MKSLEGKASELQNLLVEVMDVPTLAKTTQAGDLKKCLEEVEAFVKKFRVYSVLLQKKVSSSEMPEDQCEKESASVKTWMQSAQLHLDGTSALAKRAKGWLS